ncbi:splicing factor Cactin-like isoform X1 [Lotus japonicus]|uniref:splicing factor Cactin-like isoform X1 n=1 Tax=Lotus japonicus TaxID=34305 RepID=UPI00258AC9E4|nr:splicing factor Cactin-like isoform X1 [Lotus japonicus]
MERKRRTNRRSGVAEDEILKKAMRVVKKLKTKSGYSNDSNPFGDSNLNDKFLWLKKVERDLSLGVAFSIKGEKERQRVRKMEIEKQKKRKQHKAMEKAQHEEQMALLARARARAEFQDWEQKEQDFDFHQSKVRSEIRLREGRARPIDVLAQHLNGSDDFDIKIPYMIFKGLTVKELNELRDDIKMHLDFDRATPTHVKYWEALHVVCDWELGEARRTAAAQERGLHSSVEPDVKSLLLGRSLAELDALQIHIDSEMRTGRAKVVEYWEAILKHLHIYKAKACLQEIHAKMRRKHLQLSQDKLTTAIPEEVEDEAGPLSPQLLHVDHNEDEEAIDPEQDRAILERKHLLVLQQCQTRIAAPSDDHFEMKAIKVMGPMEDGDALFGSAAQVNLDSQVYWGHDKDRPRKPKYFNRVHTGYEWNKYNRTHYDHDNPPPKIVQGYKFNIFYPDLVDNGKAPTYSIEKDGSSNGETCIIKFHAGPPYEDLSFRIVNHEWEFSQKKGFKVTFEHGIFHLYFNFKRYSYRR